MNYFDNTVDPGSKEVMSTGAQRGNATGKGKYVLISPIGMRRIAGVYERGAALYGENNWKKGMKISRTLDSAIRHLYQYLGGDRSEDHLAQAAWNVFAAMHFEETRPDLNDVPEKEDGGGATPDDIIGEDYSMKEEDANQGQVQVGGVIAGHNFTSVEPKRKGLLRRNTRL